MSENYELRWTENIIAKREKLPESQGIFGVFNKVWLSGKIEEDFKYSHNKCGRNFYKIRIECLRKSGTKDIIPVIIPEELISANILKEESRGKYVEVSGELRSNDSRGTDGKRHLHIYVFAKFINVCEREEDLKEAVDLNLIYLDGHLCRQPAFRETFFNKEITDLIISVRRDTKKNYIPCVAWGKLAHRVNAHEIGDRIAFYGRIQSRQYFKRFSEDSEEGEIKEVYEVSIMNMQVLQ